MSGSCFADRLEKHLNLTERERTALARLEENQRKVKRGAMIQRANETITELFVLRAGRVMSYVILPDGSRQILRVYFAGDFIGSASTVYSKSPESLVALSDSVLCPFDKHALRVLLEEHPRVAALMFVLSQMERVSLTDRLASLGRSSARARVASFLLDIIDRLRLMDDGITDSFDLKLTQEEIGDAVGLTSVHVNRMIRQMEADGLISRSNGRITLLNEKALEEIGHYTNRYTDLDLDWLPNS
ncbi:Crp/Fnr family transcriptional regulator [Sphingobium phenoxybenzoativorans]|uniref:Crp/Fnr family transcriptional regulator n=1 Tax=Sphingobium phenoxybenzoativorans TaxID=1592790 RepID=UPI001FE75CA7|nr:Crp/Fnr family transcriptional regulator [Sphingobium phenoxybenzoativorans]